MVAEPLQTASSAPAAGGGATVTSPTLVPPPRCKYRLRFRKGQHLRLVSHHDLMHVFERMLRRAQLPVAHTQGFHPQPRMVFALSLALGIVGTNEVLELDLTEELQPESLHERLAAQAPPGLEILSVRRLEGKSSSLVRRAFYRLPLPETAEALALADPPALPQRCLELQAQSHLWVERTRPQPRTLDIRPYLSELQVRDGNLEIAIWVTPTGTARPEEFARLVGLGPLLEAGVYFERSNLEMMDETVTALPELQTNHHQEVPTEGVDSALPMTAREPAVRLAARPTALIPGPMSFDS